MSDALEAMVAHYPTAGERARAASTILHEIRRRQRRALMAASRLKVCPRCKKSQERANFRRDASRVDGLDGLCRACRSTA